MSLKFVTGNIFESGCQALVNPVNTVGVMGSGLALEFKKTFPANFRAYEAACKEGRVVIGKMFVTEEVYKGKKVLIVNFPTKTQWHLASSLDFIQQGLVRFKSGLQSTSITSVAVPALGCGRGGVDWPDVKELLIDHLGDVEGIDIMVYEPPA